MATLAPSQFERIAEIAKRRWGLCFSEKKLPLVTNRLASFIRRSPFKDVQSYLDHLEKHASEEDMLVFFDILSTNVTSFFRDPAHFECLEREFFTPLARGNTTTPGRRIRIWSAACSTGQEPYSLAMSACESLPDLDSWDVKILGTDLSNSAVAQARSATYPADKLDGIPPAIAERHLIHDRRAGTATIAPRARGLVTIARLNLMDAWPFKSKFDVIFCRNVMIYFDAPTRRDLVKRFHELLHPGGILALGSSESLAGLNAPFTPVQPSVYRSA